MTCLCGASEKECGGTYQTDGPEKYLKALVCNQCGSRNPFLHHGESGKCEKCEDGVYKNQYEPNRNTRCSRCNDHSTHQNKGSRCTNSVCAVSGDQTYKCEEYSRMLERRASFEGRIGLHNSNLSYEERAKKKRQAEEYWEEMKERNSRAS